MIRLSYGSMVALGLKNYKLNAFPTTIYAILGEKCEGMCIYCGQKSGGNRLGLVTWYRVDEDVFLKKIEEYRNFRRICFEVLHYEKSVEDLAELARKIKKVRDDIILSATMTQLSESEIKLLKESGVDALGIGLDASTEEIFNKVKIGRDFKWENFWNTAAIARKYFDEVAVHVIVGLGETDHDLYRTFRKIKEMKCKIALFNLVNEDRTSSVEPARYYSIQIMRHLIENYYESALFEFDCGKLSRIYVPKDAHIDILKGIPFMTSGCTYCNRPGYTDTARGPTYNFPYAPSENDINKILLEVKKYVEVI